MKKTLYGKKFHENRDKRTFDSAWIVAECFFEHSGGYEGKRQIQRLN